MTFQQHVETSPLISSEGWKELVVFPGGFLSGAMVKNLPANAGDARDSVGSIPPGGLISETGGSFGQEMAIHSSILVWFPIQERSYMLHGAPYHQMVNTEIKLTIFFAAKDGEALYSQQRQDRELAVAQIMNFLLPNSDLN